jgi:nicotinamide-nucleotide amidase
MGADVGLSVTGLIGSPSEGKPPGLIYVAAAGPGGVRVARLQDDRGPEANRGDAVRAALRLCCEVVSELPEPELSRGPERGPRRSRS